MKEAVLPFNRFPEVDPVLGPEMRSTGEVMGIDRTFGLAFAKASWRPAPCCRPTGTVFLSLADRDKPAGLVVASGCASSGSASPRPQGTADYLGALRHRRSTRCVAKVSEGDGIDAVDLIAAGKVSFVVNTPAGPRRPQPTASTSARRPAVHRRRRASPRSAPALAAAEGMAERAGHELSVRSLQEYHGGRATATDVPAGATLDRDADRAERRRRPARSGRVGRAAPTR